MSVVGISCYRTFQDGYWTQRGCPDCLDFAVEVIDKDGCCPVQKFGKKVKIWYNGCRWTAVLKSEKEWLWKMTKPAIISQALLTRHANCIHGRWWFRVQQAKANCKKARATWIMGERTLLSHSFFSWIQYRRIKREARTQLFINDPYRSDIFFYLIRLPCENKFTEQWWERTAKQHNLIIIG